MNVFIGGSKIMTIVHLFIQHKLRYQVNFAGRTQVYNLDTAILSLLIATCQSLTLLSTTEQNHLSIFLSHRNDLLVKQTMTG